MVEGSSQPPFALLLLEDNPTHAELIEDTLTEYDQGQFDLDYCDSEEAFFQYLKQKNYDGLLIDFFLKDTSGKEIFQKLKAKSVQIPVIFISSANLEEIYDELKDLGAIGFISKTQTSLKTLAFYLKRKLSKIRKGPPEHHAE